MYVNVYDFDKTIIDKDSGVAFVRQCLKKYPLKVSKSLLCTIPTLILMLFKKRNLMDVKSKIVTFVNKIDLDNELKIFWDENEKCINSFYKEMQEKDDVFISANYDFILKPICKRLGVKNLIATHYDFEKKKLVGKHSKGIHKVELFYEIYPGKKINKAYSDSKVDIPLLEEAKQGYVVKHGNVFPYKKGYFK